MCIPLPPQLLATAEEEVTRHSSEAALLRKAVDSQSSLRASAEGRAAEEHRRRLDLEHRVEELEAAAAEHAAVAGAQEAELVQTRAELQRSRAEALALAEDKARLEVGAVHTREGPCQQACELRTMCTFLASSTLFTRAHVKRRPKRLDARHPTKSPPFPWRPAMPQVEGQQLRRDYQTTEIMGLSLRERLAGREGELQELSARHQQLQAEQAATSAALLESQSSLSGLQTQHESLQASAAQQAAKLQAELSEEHACLADVRRELVETQAERAALGTALQEAGSRETTLTAQLKQLAGAHEQQTAKLRQETNSRRTSNDELQALRAGLQVGSIQQMGCCNACLAGCAPHVWVLSLSLIWGPPGLACVPAGYATAPRGPGPRFCQRRGTPYLGRGLARSWAHQPGSAGEHAAGARPSLVAGTASSAVRGDQQVTTCRFGTRGCLLRILDLQDDLIALCLATIAAQVVTAINQQLGEMIARKAELQHELGVAKERWQTEESVRIRWGRCAVLF